MSNFVGPPRDASSWRGSRFQNAARLKREPMMQNHTTFFKPWESIFEGNPQQILERHEPVNLMPILIMQGGLDDNMLPAVQEKFAQTYRAAGGDCQYRAVRRLCARVGRDARTADRPSAGDGQDVHRAAAQDVGHPSRSVPAPGWAKDCCTRTSPAVVRPSQRTDLGMWGSGPRALRALKVGRTR